jgi:glycosyltransferase involved in cell wall biosynthesis
MKVALVVSDLQVRGGTQKQVLRLAQDLIRRGVDVQIFTFEYSSSGCYEEFQSLPVRLVSRRSGALFFRIASSITAALRILANMDRDTDIINVHDLGCDWVLLLARLWLPKAKLVWQINDLHPAFHLGPFRNLKPKWTHRIHRQLHRWLAKIADQLTVNVTKNKDRIRDCMGAESRVFYCGVDQLAANAIERKLHQPIALVSTGVFFPYRNYESLVRAMGVLRNRGISTRLTLVGSTQYCPEYADRIRSLACAEGVELRIAGAVDDGDLKQILLQSDLFLFANIDQSWGLAVFEAMSMSLPVVLSRSAGAVEVLANRPGVHLVDAEKPESIASGIEAIAKTQERFADTCSQAFATVSTLKWSDTYCREMFGLFEELSLSGSRLYGSGLQTERY